MKIAGVFTAMVTPFVDGKVDFDKIKELVATQLEAGIDGLVPMGTTGESPTLAMDEHLKVIETVVNAVSGKCLVVAGTGANSTAEAVELTKIAKSMGVDATLQVTPYYNKPPQEGLYRHFSTVADECGLPVILYNVPGRSGVPIEIATIARLASNPNVVCVKEAGGSAERVSKILDACEITVLSGDDALTIPMMSIGATGVISVASNLAPVKVKAMVDAFAAGETMEAMRLHRELYPFFRDIFVETNPVPIKAAMAMRGLIQEEYRLPLCPIAPENMKTLAAAMEKAGV